MSNPSLHKEHQTEQDKILWGAAGGLAGSRGSVGVPFGEVVISGDELHISLYGGGEIADHCESCQLSVQV